MVILKIFIVTYYLLNLLKFLGRNSKEYSILFMHFSLFIDDILDTKQVSLVLSKPSQWFCSFT